ncbi:MAG: hypothetical protein KDA87_01415 [Planctomycetales bacterium]|nr:hypothetical protein [Planctomycetales bacterium]
MKGPYERLKYDGHRIWECPACHHRERTAGDRTTCICGCQNKLPLPQRRWMRLVEDGVRLVDRETRTHVAAEPTAQDQIAS